MADRNIVNKGSLVAIVTVLAVVAGTGVVRAVAPCGDFGECKTLVEINARDGDIGFHFLMDGDDLNSARLLDPDGAKIFEDKAKGPLLEQKLTETFAESAEPLCWPDPEADEDEEIVTLEEFLDRWTAGTYTFRGMGDEGEMSEGESMLTYELPAAPTALTFDGSVISWAAGDDLGNCASNEELDDLVMDEVLPIHPELVEVVAWEIVLEPDVDDDDPTGNLVYSIRVAGDIPVKSVEVPASYLGSLPPDTPVKIEVGAIGEHDNATFWEEDGFCVNVDEGCEEEE